MLCDVRGYQEKHACYIKNLKLSSIEIYMVKVNCPLFCHYSYHTDAIVNLAF